MKATQFRKCSLEKVDFIETDLYAAVFDDCDLNGAMFENTIFEKVDV